MAASDAELYVNVLMHYLGDWVGARIMPITANQRDRSPSLFRSAPMHIRIEI